MQYLKNVWKWLHGRRSTGGDKADPEFLETWDPIEIERKYFTEQVDVRRERDPKTPIKIA